MTIPVVAGLVVQDGKILICGGEKKIYRGFKWEFPGGKLEAMESPEAALQRELLEELGIKACVGRVYDVVRHVYDDAERDVLVLFYIASIAQGQPTPLDGQSILWVSSQALRDYDFAPADQPVVMRLLRDGLPCIGCSKVEN